MIDSCKIVLKNAVEAKRLKGRNIFEEVKITIVSKLKQNYLTKCHSDQVDHGIGFKLRLEGSVGE